MAHETIVQTAAMAGRRRALGLAAAGAVAASCGITRAARAASPLKIGIVGPRSGPYAIIGQEVDNGFRLYFDQVGNEVAGRYVQLIFADAQGKPEVGLTKVQELVEHDHVDLLGGIVSSSVAYAIRDYVAKKDVPLVMTVSGADGLTQQLAAKNIFRTNGSGSQTGQVFGDWLYDHGYRRLIIIAPAYAMGYEETGGFARTFEMRGGKVVKAIYPPLGTPDYGPFLSTIDPKSADAIGAVFAGGDAIRFVQQYAEYGLKGKIPLVGIGLLTDDLILQKEGGAAIGTITALNYANSIETPENKAFVAAYLKRFGRRPTAYAEYSYVGARVMKDAVAAVAGDTADTAKLLAAMSKVAFTAPRGPFRFDSYNNAINNIYVYRVEKQDGRLINKVIDTIPNVSQFYKWTPKEFLALPKYTDIPNSWVK